MSDKLRRFLEYTKKVQDCVVYADDNAGFRETKDAICILRRMVEKALERTRYHTDGCVCSGCEAAEEMESLIDGEG